jgi:hypothetical protein
MKPDAAPAKAAEIMAEFARLTGLAPAAEFPRRYLWTDAFAVCNFLELYRRTSDEKYKDLALGLVRQVHNQLGRHREDDPRTGWISGLGEEEGQKHPTAGGLRIGKKMIERRPGAPFNERPEWDRDGQYYHYLTKWMHSLSRVSRATGDSIYLTWARELARTAHAKFTYPASPGGPKRMYWKMSIDLSYPLVPSMGQHDPLDGFITYNELQAGPKITGRPAGPDLHREISELAAICEGKNWETDDPLGLGGVLSEAYRLAQLIVHGHLKETDLLEHLLESSAPGLESYATTESWRLPADYRLAFRELGLSMGLRALEKLQTLVKEKPEAFQKEFASQRSLETLMRFAGFSRIIEDFWLDTKSREAESWKEHRDINLVMLATSLAPEGYLSI